MKLGCWLFLSLPGCQVGVPTCSTHDQSHHPSSLHLFFSSLLCPVYPTFHSVFLICARIDYFWPFFSITLVVFFFFFCLSMALFPFFSRLPHFLTHPTSSFPTASLSSTLLFPFNPSVVLSKLICLLFFLPFPPLIPLFLSLFLSSGWLHYKSKDCSRGNDTRAYQ